MGRWKATDAETRGRGDAEHVRFGARLWSLNPASPDPSGPGTPEVAAALVRVPMLGYFVSGNLGNFIDRNEDRPLQVKLNDIKGSSQVPLVVLVGSETASFGEIFAGILQDVGRAYLIGKTTEGNVEILWGYDLEDGSKIWLANETFQPLNHPEKNWEKMGIIPDLIQSGEFDEFSLENDPVVKAAIGYLSER